MYYARRKALANNKMDIFADSSSIIQDLQSWTKLVASYFPIWKHQQDAFAPPSTRSMLFGRTEDSSGGFWWQSNIDKGERGKDLLWSVFSRPRFSFIPKYLNSFVRDCSYVFLPLNVIVRNLRASHKSAFSTTGRYCHGLVQRARNSS